VKDAKGLLRVDWKVWADDKSFRHASEHYTALFNAASEEDDQSLYYKLCKARWDMHDWYFRELGWELECYA
jgi:hypothetical protein